MNNCYGHYNKKNTECATCDYGKWCKDANDPYLLTYNQYDDELQQPENESTIENNIWNLTAYIIWKIYILCKDDYSLFTIIAGKMAGLSYSDIGSITLISKQMVHKKIKKIKERNKILGQLLSRQYSRRSKFVNDLKVNREYSQFKRELRLKKERHKKWMTKKGTCVG